MATLFAPVPVLRNAQYSMRAPSAVPTMKPFASLVSSALWSALFAGLMARVPNPNANARCRAAEPQTLPMPRALRVARRAGAGVGRAARLPGIAQRDQRDQALQQTQCAEGDLTGALDFSAALPPPLGRPRPTTCGLSEQ